VSAGRFRAASISTIFPESGSSPFRHRGTNRPVCPRDLATSCFLARVPSAITPGDYRIFRDCVSTIRHILAKKTRDRVYSAFASASRSRGGASLAAKLDAFSCGKEWTTLVHRLHRSPRSVLAGNEAGKRNTGKEEAAERAELPARLDPSEWFVLAAPPDYQFR